MSTLVRRWLALTLVAAATVGSAILAPLPAAAVSGFTSTAQTIYYWNDVLLEAFRRQGGAPTPLSRAAAIMHTGIFEVIQDTALARTSPPFYTNYLTTVSADPDVDDNLAAGIVARDLLSFALPAQAAFAAQKFTERHGSASQPEATQLATEIVNLMRDRRTGDGSEITTTYTLDGVPGSWRPTGSADCNDPGDAATPNWGGVQPFTMPSTTAFRQPLPGGFSTYAGLLGSSLYTAQFNEVKSLGRYDSTTRTQEQTNIAFFWANDVNTTYKPPGQLLSHTRIVTQNVGQTDPLALSRTFALVSLTMADAGIAAWDQKFRTTIDLWRPDTAIDQAANDGNPNTAPDAAWQPLSIGLDGQRFSPCFPAWVSGHATFAGAWARTMNFLFGNVTFTATTEDPSAQGVTRTFTTFAAAAAENARSRIYLGVHFTFDGDDGLDSGNALADFAVQNFLIPYF